MQLIPFILLLAAMLPCQDEPPGGGSNGTAAQGSLNGEAGEAVAGYSLRGSLDLKWLGRRTGGDHDSDLYAYGNFDLGDPKQHLFTVHASGRLAFDLDRNRDSTHPFRSGDDTFSKDLTARLYSGYVDLNGIAGNPLQGLVKRVRLGRQIFYDTPRTLFLDGVSVETVPWAGHADMIVQAYFGVPSHLFESSPSGDIAAGAALSIEPWSGGRLRLDYMHVTDEYLSTTSRDDLLGIRLDQSITSQLFVSAHINTLDFDRSRDLGASASWNLPDQDLTVTARFTALLGDQKRRSIDLDYLTEIESTYFSYYQYDLNLHKGFGDHLYLEGGAQFRELREDSKEGIFNHEFRRYFASPGVAEWPWEGADASLTYESWDSDGDRFTAIGADFTQDFDEKWRGSVGTFFELFRYDALRGVENEDVQVSYAKLVYKVRDNLRLRFRFEYEDGELDDYYTLTLGARIDF